MDGAELTYQAHPDHAGLVDEVIDWYDEVAAGLERTVNPCAGDDFALGRWAAHGYQTDLAALADDGEWTQLNQRDLIDIEEPGRRADSGSAPLTRPGRRPPSRPI